MQEQLWYLYALTACVSGNQLLPMEITIIDLIADILGRRSPKAR